MTIQQANQYFAALPDGFADPAQLGALLPASVQQVQFVGVAGTAGKTAVARLLTAILQAQGIRAGVYHAGCEPLAARIRVADFEPSRTQRRVLKRNAHLKRTATSPWATEEQFALFG